jgi:hypothetical protein
VELGFVEHVAKVGTHEHGVRGGGPARSPMVIGLMKKFITALMSGRQGFHSMAVDESYFLKEVLEQISQLHHQLSEAEHRPLFREVISLVH